MLLGTCEYDGNRSVFLAFLSIPLLFLLGFLCKWLHSGVEIPMDESLLQHISSCRVKAASSSSLYPHCIALHCTLSSILPLIAFWLAPPAQFVYLLNIFRYSSMCLTHIQEYFPYARKDITISITFYAVVVMKQDSYNYNVEERKKKKLKKEKTHNTQKVGCYQNIKSFDTVFVLNYGEGNNKLWKNLRPYSAAIPWANFPHRNPFKILTDSSLDQLC